MAMKTSSGSIPHPSKIAPFSIPPIIHDLIEFVEEYGVQTEGIFRINGRSEDIAAIKKHYKKGKKVDLFSYSIHTIAGALKSYLCEMDPPLIARIVFETFAVAQTYDEGKALRVMRKVLQSSLTAENKIVLIRCCDLLQKVYQNQAKTRMTIESLAIVFAPTWMRLESTTIADYMSNQKLQAKCVEYIILNIKYLLLKKAGEELSRVKLKNIDSSDAEFEQFMKAMQNGSLRSASNILLNQYDPLTSEKFEQQADALINSKNRNHSRSVRTIFDFEIDMPQRAIDDNGPPQSPSARSRHSKRALHSRQQSAIDPSEVRRKMTNENLPPVTFTNTLRRGTSGDLERQRPDPSDSDSSTVKISDSSEEYGTARRDTIDTSSDNTLTSSEVTASESLPDDSSSTNNTNAPAPRKTRSQHKKPKKRVSRKNVGTALSISDSAITSSSKSNLLDPSSPRAESGPNSDSTTNKKTEGPVSITVSAPKPVKDSAVIKAALQYQERTKKPEEVVTPLLESSKKTEEKIRQKQQEQRQHKKSMNNNVTFDRAQSEYNNTGSTNDIANFRAIHKSLSEGENDKHEVSSPAAEPRAVVITKTEPMDVKAFVTTINKNNNTGTSPKSSVGSPTKTKVAIPKRPVPVTSSNTSEVNSKNGSPTNSPSKARSNSAPKNVQAIARPHATSTPPPKQGNTNTPPNGPSTAPGSVMSATVNNTGPATVNATVPEQPKVVAQPEIRLVEEKEVIIETAVIETELKLEPSKPTIAESPKPAETSDSIRNVVAYSTPNMKFRPETSTSSNSTPTSSSNGTDKPLHETPTRLAAVLSPRRHQELTAKQPSTQNSIDELILSALSKTAVKKADLPTNDILNKLQKLQPEKNNNSS
jgi:hypothetical protein